MSLAHGTRLGPYEIVASLGAGGMGEVYRARDTKLDRDVALKILPEIFAADPDRLMRFEREAKSLAALNHPNIAQVYGIEDSAPAGAGQAAARALVMELVEGDDLSARIARGPIAIDEALPIARQIADALEAAHEQGIIHRDLKPANIKVRADGMVKVLDFGLAKAMDSGVGSGERGVGSALANSPTITSPALTMRGVILGTAAYMSPEQAKGRAVDKRADIWAFGCVLFEMLTGRRAFDGEDIADTLVAVLSKEPAWDALPSATPPRVRRLLRRCLQKDPRRRLRDIGDARDDVEDATDNETPVPGSAGSAAPYASRRERVAWALVAALGIGLGLVVLAAFWPRSEPIQAPDVVVRFTLAPPEGRAFSAQATSLAFSPDGRTLAFVTPDIVGGGLWIRPLDSVESREVRVAAPIVNWAAASPAWSPDGRFLVMTAGGGLGGPVRRIGVDGGPSTTLADSGSNAHWSPAGVILYTGRDGHVYQVPEQGGASTPVTTLDTEAGELAHIVSALLPGGRRFLVLAQNRTAAKSTTYLASLDSAERTPLSGLEGRVRYAAGALWFLRDNTLMRQAFDADAARATGEPEPVVEDVDVFAVSLTGTVVTKPRDRAGLALSWLDDGGKPTGAIGPPGEYRGMIRPDLSPDGRLLAFTRRDAQDNTDVWILDLERNVPTRLTSDAAVDDGPIFSPDGSFVVFSSNRGEGVGLYRRAADGRGEDELLFASSDPKQPTGFSPDGRLLLFRRSTLETGADVWVLPLDGTRTPRPLANTSAQEGYATFSPDGRWFAYCAGAGETGEQDQVFVEPYPPTGARVRLSTTTGSSPLWSGSGREVFYGTLDGDIMRVEVTPVSNTLKAGVPRLLVKTSQRFAHNSFVLDRTKTRVLTPSGGDTAASQSLTVTMRVPQ